MRWTCFEEERKRRSHGGSDRGRISGRDPWTDRVGSHLHSMFLVMLHKCVTVRVSY